MPLPNTGALIQKTNYSQIWERLKKSPYIQNHSQSRNNHKNPKRVKLPLKDEISFSPSLPSSLWRDSCSDNIRCCMLDSAKRFSSLESSPAFPTSSSLLPPSLPSSSNSFHMEIDIAKFERPPPLLWRIVGINSMCITYLSVFATCGWGVWNYFKFQVLKITGNFDPLGRLATTGPSPGTFR